MSNRRAQGAEHPDYPTVIGHERPIWTTVQTDGAFISITGMSVFDPWLAGIAETHRDDLAGWLYRTLIRGADLEQQRLLVGAAESAAVAAVRLRQTLAVMSQSPTANHRLQRHAEKSRDDLVNRLLRFEELAAALRSADA